MRIKRLELKNFRNFEDTTLEFRNKIVVLAAKNGRGKSTILKAIRYAQTGQMDEKLEDLINTDTKADTFTVRQEAEHRGKGIIFEGSYNKKSGSSKVLNCDGEQFKNSEADAFMSTLHDPRITLYTSFSEQHESTSLISDKPSERLNIFKKIIGMDDLDMVDTRIGEDLTTLKSDIEVMLKEIQVLSGISYTLAVVPERPTKNSADIQKEIDKETERLTQVKLLEEKYNSYLLKKQAYDRAVQEKAELLVSLSNIDDKIASIKENLIVPADPQGFIELLATLKQEYVEESSKHLSYEADLKIKAKIDAVKVELEKLVPVRAVKKEEVHGYTLLKDVSGDILSKQVELTSKLNNLKAELKLIEQGKCGTCGQDYHGDDKETLKLIQETEQKIINLSSILTDYRAALDAKVKNEQAISEYNYKKELLTKQLNEVESEFKNISKPESDLESLHKTIREKQSQTATIKSDWEKYQKDNESLSIQVALKEATEIKINSLVLPEIPEIVSKPNSDASRLTELTTELVNVNNVLTRIHEALEHNKRQEEKRQAELLRIEELNKAVQAKERELASLTEFRSILKKDFASWKIEASIAKLKHNMQSLFSRVYGRFFIDIRATARSIDYMYSRDGEKFLPVSSMSGWEKQLFANTVRCGFMNFQDYGLMVLDEVDSDSDVENSRMFYENIAQFPFEQLICVTHKPETIEMLENEYDAQVIHL